jgi:hypothetical protein
MIVGFPIAAGWHLNWATFCREKIDLNLGRGAVLDTDVADVQTSQFSIFVE